MSSPPDQTTVSEPAEQLAQVGARLLTPRTSPRAFMAMARAAVDTKSTTKLSGSAAVATWGDVPQTARTKVERKRVREKALDVGFHLELIMVFPLSYCLLLLTPCGGY